jgi:uncharacterized protein YcbK (DUF882 family)
MSTQVYAIQNVTNVRSQPSTSSKVIGQITSTKFAVFVKTIKGQDNKNWHQVIFNNLTGFVSAEVSVLRQVQQKVENVKFDPEEQLTSSFKLKHLVSAMMPKQAIDLNWKHITNAQYLELKKTAQLVQEIEEKVNKKFIGKNNQKIRLVISCGLRVPEWERIQRRSGASQHVHGKAADFYPDINTVVSASQFVEICAWIMNEYKNWNGGLAFKRHSVSNDRVVSIGFIHIDTRIGKARWEY